jgi:hypothetical protein
MQSVVELPPPATMTALAEDAVNIVIASNRPGAAARLIPYLLARSWSAFTTRALGVFPDAERRKRALISR